MPQFSFDIYVDNKIKMMSEIALWAVHERGGNFRDSPSTQNVVYTIYMYKIGTGSFGHPQEARTQMRATNQVQGAAVAGPDQSSVICAVVLLD